MSLKFFYNGIKGADGKLQKASYSLGNWTNKPETMLRIYGKNYNFFSTEIKGVLKVEDGSDMQSDYFENEHIDIYETNPLYPQVLEAYKKQELHKRARWAKRGPTHCHCGNFHVYGSCRLQEVA